MGVGGRKDYSQLRELVDVSRRLQMGGRGREDFEGWQWGGGGELGHQGPRRECGGGGQQ